MAQALYKKYENRRPCGAVALSNCFGLLVFEPMEEDRDENTDFITAWSGGDSLRGFHRNKVHETSGGRLYIRKGSQRFYLDEIMKV